MPKLTDFSGRPTSGTVPFAVVGLVTDNVDPDGLGRIKVKFPTLPQEPTSFWLRQISPNAGKERGFYALPEKEDEVLVLFMQGSQDVGVIIGQFWNGVDKPPGEAGDGAAGKIHASKFGNDAAAGGGALDKNDRRFWKSRSGALFVFDDKDGAETVEIWDKSRSLSIVMDTAGTFLHISNKDGNIEISAGGDITMTAGGNIKWDAGENHEGKAGGDMTLEVAGDYTLKADGDAKIDAANVKIKAQTAFEAKATSAKMEGSGDATVKGGTLDLKGDSMATLKASIVNIN